MKFHKTAVLSSCLLALVCIALAGALFFGVGNRSSNQDVATLDIAEDDVPLDGQEKPQTMQTPDSPLVIESDAEVERPQVSGDAVTAQQDDYGPRDSAESGTDAVEDPASVGPDMVQGESPKESSTTTSNGPDDQQAGSEPAAVSVTTLVGSDKKESEPKADSATTSTGPERPTQELSTNQPPPTSDTFGCLSVATAVDTSMKGKSQTGKKVFAPAQDEALDLRGAVIRVHDKAADKVAGGEPVVDSRWGLIQAKTNSDTCIAGGYVYSKNPLNATWEQTYDTEGLGNGYRLGTARNSSAVDFGGGSPEVTGMHWYNMHDGPRFNSADGDWSLQHSWGEYTRDDCVENDEVKSGRIYDTLFDGCYSGYSNRPSKSNDVSTGAGNIVMFDKVLLRMELQPGPYKACERKGDYFGPDGSSFDEARHGACSPGKNIFGMGNLFKLANDNARNPKFVLRDSVFVIPADVPARKADFPAATNISECENVTIVYLGDSSYPGQLPDTKFPSCFTIKTGDEGRSFWKAKVADWHARHPEVGKTRKPTSPGSLSFPRKGLNF